MDVDLLNPVPNEESTNHKLKLMIQSPNSVFTDVNIPMVPADLVHVLPHRPSCFMALAAKCCASPRVARLTEGSSFRRKVV